MTTEDLRQKRRDEEITKFLNSKTFRRELYRKLNAGEREYKTLPSTLKCQRGVVLNSKFEEILEHAPESAWKDRYFIESVWINLGQESEIRYNIPNYTRFIDKINDKTIIEGLLTTMKGNKIIKEMLSTYIKSGRIIV